MNANGLFCTRLMTFTEVELSSSDADENNEI